MKNPFLIDATTAAEAIATIAGRAVPLDSPIIIGLLIVGIAIAAGVTFWEGN